jgi:hypothetical protein
VDPHASLQELAIFDGDAWCIDVADNGGRLNIFAQPT